jgi:hypothetical protein
MLEIYLPTLFVNHFANSVQAIIGATILPLTICPSLANPDFCSFTLIGATMLPLIVPFCP